MAGGIPRFESDGYLPPLYATTVLAKTIKLNQRRACDFLSVSYQEQYQKYARVCIVLGICIYYDGNNKVLTSHYCDAAFFSNGFGFLNYLFVFPPF